MMVLVEAQQGGFGVKAFGYYRNEGMWSNEFTSQVRQESVFYISNDRSGDSASQDQEMIGEYLQLTERCVAGSDLTVQDILICI